MIDQVTVTVHFRVGKSETSCSNMIGRWKGVLQAWWVDNRWTLRWSSSHQRWVSLISAITWLAFCKACERARKHSNIAEAESWDLVKNSKPSHSIRKGEVGKTFLHCILYCRYKDGPVIVIFLFTFQHYWCKIYNIMMFSQLLFLKMKKREK